MAGDAKHDENGFAVGVIFIAFTAFLVLLTYAVFKGSSPRLAFMGLFGGLSAAFATLTISALSRGDFIGTRSSWTGLGGDSSGTRVTRATVYLGLCVLFTIACLQALPNAPSP